MSEYQVYFNLLKYHAPEDCNNFSCRPLKFANLLKIGIINSTEENTVSLFANELLKMTEIDTKLLFYGTRFRIGKLIAVPKNEPQLHTTIV